MLKTAIESWNRPALLIVRSPLAITVFPKRFDLLKDGNIGFSDPQGTHDDVFWSIPLAVHATANMEPEPFLATIPR